MCFVGETMRQNKSEQRIYKIQGKETVKAEKAYRSDWLFGGCVGGGITKPQKKLKRQHTQHTQLMRTQCKTMWTTDYVWHHIGGGAIKILADQGKHKKGCTYLCWYHLLHHKLRYGLRNFCQNSMHTKLVCIEPNRVKKCKCKNKFELLNWCRSHDCEI